MISDGETESFDEEQVPRTQLAMGVRGRKREYQLRPLIDVSPAELFDAMAFISFGQVAPQKVDELWSQLHEGAKRHFLVRNARRLVVPGGPRM